MTQVESEFMECTKAKSEILKWKLLVVGALAAVGFGLDKETNSAWALCLIPILCLYVDLVYRNLCLRIQTIESFIVSMRNEKELETTRAFIVFHQNNMRDINDMSLEAGALVGSSVLFNFIVFLSPFVIKDFCGIPNLPISLHATGLIGVIAALLLESWYRHRDGQLLTKGTVDEANQP